MLALRLDCSAGMATLTTEPSMKAMAEPRMVATRTQVPAVVEGSVRLPERIKDSSRGDFPKLDMRGDWRGILLEAWAQCESSRRSCVSRGKLSLTLFA